MQAILGIIFHFIGGAASGSFYVPYKKVKKWHWENYWIIGGLFSWLIVPPLAAWLTLPDFTATISMTVATTLRFTILFGVLWGIGGLTYGLGIRYLGMSLGNSVILGCCSVFGALVPSIYYDYFPAEGKTTFYELVSTSWGQLVLLGVLLCLAGIFICGRAGMLKEKETRKEAGPLKESEPLDEAEPLKESGALKDAGYPKEKGSFRTAPLQPVEEFNLMKGLIVAVFSGIMSACFNFGIEAGKPLAEIALSRGAHPLFQNNVIFVVLLWGGLATNLIWCLFLNLRNRSFGDYIDRRTPLLRNYLFSALAGTIWFLQFFFYGMGESKLGNGASSWILHMSFIILVANIWGIMLKEWKGVSRRTLVTFATGLATIIASVILVGYGNSLK